LTAIAQGPPAIPGRRAARAQFKEELLRAGDCAAFQRGVEDGHHLINKSTRPARVLEIGNSDAQDRCVYSDIDMVAEPGSERYRHRDGTPYPPKAG
jgi:uncharacterized cupin superfamily protein